MSCAAKLPLDLHPCSAGTLPPSFTQPIHSQYQHQHKLKYRHRHHASSSLTSTSHPATTSSANSILADAAAAPRALLLEVNPAVARSGVSTLLSPQNNGLRPKTSYTPARRGNSPALSQKRLRNSHQHSFELHNNNSSNNNNNIGIDVSLDQWLGAAESEESFPVVTNGAGGDGHGRGGGGGGGGLWGPTGLPPAGVEDPRTTSMPLETEWACPSSAAATSTPSLHDGFSDVSSRNQRRFSILLYEEERE